MKNSIDDVLDSLESELCDEPASHEEMYSHQEFGLQLPLETTEFDELYSYVASCVEIVGLEEAISGYIWQPLDPDDKSKTDVLDLNGHKGICVDWSVADCKYLVRTFENFAALVSPENLRHCNPDEELFDMIWPEAWSSELALDVCHIIAEKGFCRLQMFASPEAREDMLDEADKMPAFRMKQELESAYLGLDNKTKLCMLGNDTDATFARWAGDITQLGDALCENSSELGFECRVQTATYVRSSYKSRGEELHVAPQSLEDSEDWGQDVAEYVRFMDSRKLCVLHLIENQGGAVWLYPLHAKGEKSTKVAIARNTLFIFRHDCFDFSYQPIGRSLALQAWFSQGSGLEQPIKEVKLNLSEGYAFANPGVPEPKGVASSVTAVHANFPGGVYNEDHFWSSLMIGTDGVLEWPETRSYDKSLHYSPDMQEAFGQGKSYSKHGGFTSDDQFTDFDNDFFGISNIDAGMMLPTARWLLATGIQALFKAGFKKQDLNGAPIGTYVGDSGMDWATLFNRWQYMKPELSPSGLIQNVSQSTTTGRLAYIYGMKGPVLQFDTACSSSLVALSQAQSFMLGTSDDFSAKSLVMGVNAMCSVWGYLQCTAGNMLGPIGRSFSFNASAEGYTRGELCGAAYLEKSVGSTKILCSLVGCVSNHDGRSATLTAPSGPAQQELVLKSLRSAAIEEDWLTMSEYHGTGTALGDPIETGALQAVLRKRTTPLLQVCNKANFGHCEPGAGIAGFVKVVMLAKHSIGPPTLHLSQLNPNIQMDGFPGYYDSEIVDSGKTNGYAGVCSFGFAGSNARADVYFEAQVSIRKALKLELPPKSLPKAEFAIAGEDIFIVGSWTAWSSVDLMEMEGDQNDPTHTCYVKLGETRIEYFRLKLGDLLEEEKDFKTFYPAVCNADSSAQVLGPSQHCPEHTWMINGFEDGMPAGTVYKISFGKSGTQVWWTPVTDDIIEGEILGDAYEHRYFLYGSVKKNGFLPLVAGAGECHEVQFSFGPQMKEEFLIVRDKDLKQVFHLDDSGNLRGPSDIAQLDRNAKLVFHGKTNTAANLSLTVFNGTASLRCRDKSFSTI